MVTNNSVNYVPVNHNAIIGAANGNITSVAPTATSGIPLVSNGSSSDPSFSTASVSGGGTGATSLTGVLIGNGTSAVTANPITQHDVLVAGASNAITSVSPSTSGFVLTSNGTGADPSFQIIGSAGGKLVNAATSISSTAVNTTKTIAGNTTAPTTSNTFQVSSLTYTPASSSNILTFSFSAPYTQDTGAGNAFVSVVFCLFQGSTLITSFAINSTHTSGSETFSGQTASFSYSITSNTTSSTTYTVNCASISGVTPTIYLLTDTASTALFGGAGATNIWFRIVETTV